MTNEERMEFVRNTILDDPTHLVPSVNSDTVKAIVDHWESDALAGQPVVSTYKRLAALVRAEILASGHTQHEIADAVGITPKHLSGFLCGYSGMSLNLVDQVLDACDRQLVLSTIPFP